jgi:GNAT superfamily N-acetyltransferase
MPINVRRATSADLEVVVEFNRLLAEESEGKTLDLTLLRPGVQAVLHDPHKGLYFLGEIDGQIVGQMAVTFEWSDWRNGWFWWIQSVYVQSGWRRQGVFRALFHHVQQTAQNEEQVIGVRLYVEKENLVAHQTYLGLGLVWTGYQVMEKYPLDKKE